MTTLHERAPAAAPGRPSSLAMAPWASAAWAATFLALTVLALAGRTGHPWAPEQASALGGMSGAQMSWCLAAIALLVLAALSVALAGRRPGAVRAAGVVLVVLGILVAVVISDVRALAFLGYLPMLLLALADLGPVAGHLDGSVLLDSGTAFVHAVAGVAVVGAGVWGLDRAGSSDGEVVDRWRRWVRWGRPAVAVAVVVPLLYAVTRVAWALGVPLGIQRETLDELGSGRYAGLGLALFAMVGAWLTTGLLARWGEVFWTWVPRWGGRPVPVGLALGPGLVVAGAVTSAGLSFWRLVLTGELWRVPGAPSDWAAWGPELFWPLWGPALAVACLAYLARRSSGPALD